MFEDGIEKKRYGKWSLLTEKDSLSLFFWCDIIVIWWMQLIKCLQKAQWYPLILMHWVSLTVFMDVLFLTPSVFFFLYLVRTSVLGAVHGTGPALLARAWCLGPVLLARAWCLGDSRDGFLLPTAMPCSFILHCAWIVMQLVNLLVTFLVIVVSKYEISVEISKLNLAKTELLFFSKPVPPAVSSISVNGNYILCYWGWNLIILDSTLFFTSHICQVCL